MSKSATATFGILIVAFIWGAEYVVVHNAITILEPHSFNAIRFGVASFFIGLCGLIWKTRDGFSWRLVSHGCLLGLLLYLGFSLQTFGLLYTSVSNCAFITSLNVVLVPVAAMVLLRDRLRLFTVIGVSIAAAGLYFLTVAGSTPINIGDLLTLICAAMFALHIVYTGKYSRQHQALPLILLQLLTVSVLSFVSALVFEDWQRLLDVKVVSNPSVLLAILVAAILGTGLAFLIQTLAQGHLGSMRVAMILTLEPVFAAMTAFFVLNEQLPAAAGFGAGLILAGIVVTELKPMGNKEALSTVGK